MGSSYGVSQGWGANPIPSGPSTFVCQLVFVVFRSVTVVARHCASNVILNELEIEKETSGVSVDGGDTPAVAFRNTSRRGGRSAQSVCSLKTGLDNTGENKHSVSIRL